MVVSVGMFLLIIVLWLTPILIVGFSSKTNGSEKIAWILAILFISWFAWIFYMLLAPLKQRPYSNL